MPNDNFKMQCLAGNTNNPLMRSSSMGYVEQRNSYDEDILKKISNGQKGLIIDSLSGAMIKELKSKKKGLETDYSYPLFRKGKHFENNKAGKLKTSIEFGS